MTEDNRPNQTQAEIWNGPGGQTWAEHSAMLDEVLGPLNAPLLDAAAGSTQVLDVGCGAGSTTLGIAQRLRPKGQCTGIDISAPLIEAATRRAAAEGASDVTFIRGDAQAYNFAAGSFDTVLSRFGVMFFDDPVVAFANLRRALQPGGRLVFVCWRSRSENQFMTAAERAAASLVNDFPTGSDGGPGQFAFASQDRVRGILQVSGWSSIEIRPVDTACNLSAAQLPIYVTRMGPYGRIRHTLDEDVRARADAAVLAAFALFREGDRVRFTSACWLVTAIG